MDNAGKDGGRVKLHQDGQEDVVDGGHLDGENCISNAQVLGKSFSHYFDSRRRETFSIDFTVCKLQTGKCTQ